jgi:hypothetical protein
MWGKRYTHPVTRGNLSKTLPHLLSRDRKAFILVISRIWSVIVHSVSHRDVLTREEAQFVLLVDKRFVVRAHKGCCSLVLSYCEFVSITRL